MLHIIQDVVELIFEILYSLMEWMSAVIVGATIAANAVTNAAVTVKLLSILSPF